MPKFHTSIAVADLGRSIDFYRRLFGRPPDFVAADYAKWRLTDPDVNFSIRVSSHRRGLDHVGFEAESAEELAGLRARLRDAELSGADEQDAHCCHARSDKTWLADPDGVAWETFFTHEQLEQADPCCSATADAAQCCS